MTQDESATAQIAEEPADSIAEQQRLRRRLNVDAAPAKHEDELDNKPFAHRRDHPPPEAMTQDMKTLIAMASLSNFPANAPPQGVQLACSKEIVKLCFAEAAKATAVFQTSTSPDDVRLALLQVNVCLARSSEQLSQSCLAALVQSLQLPPVPPVFPPPAIAADWNPSMPGKYGDERGDSDDRQDRRDDAKERHRPRHPNSHSRRFRHGDDDDSDDRDDRHGGVHPLVWAFVLPFFFLGLFVATKKGLKHLREWREQRQLTQAGAGGSGGARSEDYAPLKTQEPSS
ncbi:hypothetical protein Gpo141_00013482 [Globisporangium polare]